MNILSRNRSLFLTLFLIVSCGGGGGGGSSEVPASYGSGGGSTPAPISGIMKISFSGNTGCNYHCYDDYTLTNVETVTSADQSVTL